MSFKYAFMGSPQIAASILTDLCENGSVPTIVVTQPPRESGRGKKLTPTAVENTARDLGIEVIATANVNTPEVLDRLRALNLDVVLVVAFGQLLKKELLELPSKFCLNIHASLLPKYRGAAPIQRSIWNGDPKTGITIQRMVKQLDAGDIYVQDEIPIENKDTSGSLLIKLADLGAKCAHVALKKAAEGDTNFIPQDPSQVSMAPKIQREEALIDWNRPASYINNQIRALQPWPVAETFLGEKRLKIFEAEISENPCKAEPGTIITDNKSHLNIACGEQTQLALTEIQLENRKKLGVEDFLKGYQGSVPYSRVGKL